LHVWAGQAAFKTGPAGLADVGQWDPIQEGEKRFSGMLKELSWMYSLEDR
jgi:hypothetical protein